MSDRGKGYIRLSSKPGCRTGQRGVSDCQVNSGVGHGKGVYQAVK